ncbi:outer membrane protein OmpK [uncultured Endozoicomonas sp.]|uniref:outer membrane protein OmpK n=1 Tax=uncultured Endozoicomonas sp. TaxID=432652 RepID=UPI00260F8835|nr:outer membrane protein OmpK [uncultured Endozoicomonas sp.]
MKLRTQIASVAAITACSFNAMASEASSWTDVQWSFANVSVNQLDWSKGTEQRNDGFKEDFVFLEVEGGAGFNWGEVYGFYDLENPFNDRENEDGKEKRVATKGTMHYYLGDSNFTVYSQVYHTNSKAFVETNTVVGLGYRYANDSGLWIKPWVGAHYADIETGYNGSNGIMAGWVAGYGFSAAGQKMSVTNWTEIEMLRADEYKDSNGTTGVNGAVALWWHPITQVSAGVQYRYASNKLGLAGNNNAMIYTVKYNF